VRDQAEFLPLAAQRAGAQAPRPHEQPSIGIIIGQCKQRTVVAFALRDSSKPIGVATYPLTATLPAELRPFSPATRNWCTTLMPWRG